MRNKVLSFILAFLTFIGGANIANATKLSKPTGRFTTRAGDKYNLDLKISAPTDYSGNVEDLTIHYMLYEQKKVGDTGSWREYSSRKFSIKGTTEVNRSFITVGSIVPQFFAAYVSAPGYTDSDIIYFSLDGIKMNLDAPIMKINGEVATQDSYNVRLGTKIELNNPNVYPCVTGDATPFMTCFGVPVGGSKTALMYEGLFLGTDDYGNVDFTIRGSYNFRLALDPCWGEGTIKEIFDSSPISDKKLTAILPTPVASWGWYMDGVRVRLKVEVPDDASLPDGLISSRIKVQEINYNSSLELNTPVTNLKTLKEFEDGVRWNMDGDPFNDCPLYEIRLSADGYAPSDPVLVSFENKKIKLPTPEVWVDGVLVEDDGSSTIEHDVYVGSKVSVRKRNGTLSGYKNDILDFPSRQVATSHVYYREWLTDEHDDNQEIDIPQTEEGDKSYFIVDNSLVGKKIYHRHIYSPNNDYKDIFEESNRTPYHSMAILKTKGKLYITGEYLRNEDDPMKMDMSINVVGRTALLAKDVTIYYIAYSSDCYQQSPYLPYYYSEKAFRKDKTVTCQYENVEGHLAPKFFAAYASAPGYEDSDVIYFKANGEELKIESPRVYVNGELVAHAELSQDDLTIPFGVEVRIENPNVYTPATVRTSAAEGETLRYKTCFGQHAYRGLPAGVSPDADGNVTFPAVVPGQEIGLELMLMPTSEAFTKSDPTICNLTVNTQTGVEDIDSESNVHEEIYTINGVRVTGKKLQKGVYVVVRNGKATKKVI